MNENSMFYLSVGKDDTDKSGGLSKTGKASKASSIKNRGEEGDLGIHHPLMIDWISKQQPKEYQSEIEEGFGR